MPDSVTPARVEPIEGVLLKIVLAFRILGWIWLALLGVSALLTDDNANQLIVSAMVIGTAAWTLFTLWMATNGDRIKSPAFVIADGVIAILVANASYFADAASNLHGGYPISWIAVVAYAYTMRWAMAAAGLLFVNQWIGMTVAGSYTLQDKLGAVVFFVYGAIVGFGFDLIRQRDALRQKAEATTRAAEAELAEQRIRDSRQREQTAIADQLHDSVLQSLKAIQSNPSEPEHVIRVAKRQERELRRTIAALRSAYDQPFVVALLRARDDVEQMYPIEVEIVCTYDAESTDVLLALVEATREAMINAAKYSNVHELVVAITVDSTTATSFVRDRGVGFNSDSMGEGSGIENSIIRRVEAVGGSASVESSPNAGTVVVMTVPTQGAT